MNELLADIVAASGGTVTAMTRNGLIQDWLNAVSTPAITIYDNIVYFGSSIMFGGFEEANKANLLTKRMMTAAGIPNVNIYTKTQSGSTSSQWRGMVDSFIVDNPSITGATLFVLQGPGNDITVGRPYSTDPNLAATESNVRYVFDKVAGKGWGIAYMGAAYKLYGDVPPESNGSLPYNENLFYPLLREYCPQWWDTVNLVPKMDSYGFFKHNMATFSSDGVHPRNVACEYVFNGWVNYYLIKSMKKLPDYNYSGKKIVTCWTDSNESTGDFKTVDGISRFLIGEISSGAANIFDQDGNLTPMAQIIGGGLANTAGRGNPANTAYGVLNHTAVSGSIYNSGTVELNSSIWLGGKQYAGLTGKIRFAGSRASTTGTRSTQYTVGGITKVINNELTIPVFVEFNFTSNADGVIEFSWMKTAASTIGYLSAIEIQFD